MELFSPSVTAAMTQEYPGAAVEGSPTIIAKLSCDVPTDPIRLLWGELSWGTAPLPCERENSASKSNVTVDLSQTESPESCREHVGPPEHALPRAHGFVSSLSGCSAARPPGAFLGLFSELPLATGGPAAPMCPCSARPFWYGSRSVASLFGGPTCPSWPWRCAARKRGHSLGFGFPKARSEERPGVGPSGPGFIEPFHFGSVADPIRWQHTSYVLRATARVHFYSQLKPSVCESTRAGSAAATAARTTVNASMMLAQHSRLHKRVCYSRLLLCLVGFQFPTFSQESKNAHAHYVTSIEYLLHAMYGDTYTSKVNSPSL